MKRAPPVKTMRAAVLVLHRRVEKLERAVFGKKSKIGFETDVRGEVLEQDEDEIEVPDEVP